MTQHPIWIPKLKQILHTHLKMLFNNTRSESTKQMFDLPKIIQNLTTKSNDQNKRMMPKATLPKIKTKCSQQAQKKTKCSQQAQKKIDLLKGKINNSTNKLIRHDPTGKGQTKLESTPHFQTLVN